MYIEDDDAVHECHECGAEFTVTILNEIDDVIFCPCCGRELYDVDDEDDGDDNSNDRWD